VKSASKLLECGDNFSLECNGFVSVTGNSNHNPSIREGIYKDLGKFFAFNRKSTETLPDILKLENLQKAMPSKHIVFTEASTTSLSFDRAEVWNLFLIAMLLFLIAESFFGLPSANIPSRSK
jgi:hypothetical protein